MAPKTKPPSVLHLMHDRACGIPYAPPPPAAPVAAVATAPTALGLAGAP